MSDEYGFDAEISLDIAKAIKAAGELARSIAKIQDATGGTDKSLDRLERTAAESGRAMEQFAKSGNAATSAAKAQQGSIQRLIKSYNDLNQAQSAQKNKGAVNQQNPLLQQRIKQEQDAAKKQAAQAAAANKQMIADEKRVRDTQLAELRSAMQRRADIENTARAETRKIAEQQARDAMALNKRRLREEEAANRQRVAQEKKTAQEIDAIWKKAHDQNAVRNATSVANGAGRGTGGADPFAGLRDTAAYTDMLDRSVQGLANQRYALYDVATTFGLISVATLGAAAAAVKLGGDYEKAFQQVARTTGLMGPELEAMRNQLVGISTDIPVAFGDIAEIATLGAQLNIANDNLAGFTTTVAQFAATTDVTVNAAAMGFGRLAQLTQTPQAEIDRLGSAIYEVGVNSVATESEILAVSQQIATAGNLAGFTNTEVVALASTLASLGVAPEQSRGAIMRVFGDITAAVGEGGDALTAFAQTSGMTAQDFATAWRDSPQEAFNAYIAGLERIIETNGDLDTSLKNQGFRNIRDRNVLTRLANNTEVYSAALSDTSRAYKENTALSEGAAIANDNLIDKLTVLVNTIKAVAAEAGQSDVLKGLVDNLTRFTKVVLEFVETPFGKTIAGLVLGTAALVGGIAAVAAGAAMGKAALLAIVTALYNSQQGANGTTLSLRALTVELLRSTSAGNAAAGAMTRFKAATAAAGGGVGGMAAAARNTASGMTTASVATSAFGNALKGVGQAAVPLLALAAIVKTVTLIQEAMKDAATVAGEYFEALEGGGTGLDAALAADTKAFEETGKAIRTVSTEVETSKTSLSGWATQLGVAAGAQVSVNDATSTTTTAVTAQTTAIGENVRAWAAQTLANDANFQALYKNQQLLKDIGFDLNAFLDATLQGPSGGTDYVQSIVAKLTSATGGYAAAAQAAGVSTEEMAQTVKSLYEIAGTYGTQIDAVATKQQIISEVMGDAGLAAQGLGEDLEGAADSALTLADGLGPLVDSMFGAVDAAASVQDAMYGLGEAMGQGGTSFSEFSEAGRANLAALQDTIAAMATQAGDNTGMFIQNVAGMLSQLEAMGVDVSGELGFVGQMLAELTNTQYGLNLDTSAANGSIKVFIDNAIRAAEAVAALEKRTYQAQQQMIANSLYVGGKAPSNNVMLPVTFSGTSAAGRAAEEQVASLKALRDGINEAGSAGVKAGNSLAQGFNKGTAAANKTGGAAKKAGKASEKAAEEVRTLLDYGSDLESVFNRSFDLRFGTTQAVDATAEALDKMKQSIKDANEAVDDAKDRFAKAKQSVIDARLAVQEFKAEAQSLKSDRRVLEYQLSVAVKYGDELRAGEIRADLAQNTVDLNTAEANRVEASKDVTAGLKEQSKAEQAIKDAQAAAKVTTTGNTAAARAQRGAVLDLVKSYEDQIVQLAESGLSTAELEAKTKALKEEFVRNMMQMGYSREEADKYARAFDDLTLSIKNVPRNVTVKASTSPAQQAINEFLTKNANRQVNLKANVTGIPSNIGGGTYSPSRVNVGSGGISTPKISSTNASFSLLTVTKTNIAGMYQQNGSNRPVWTGGYIGPGFARGGLIPGKTPSNHKVDNVQGMGPNGPIRVQSGEYIQNSRAVRYYGLPFMNALNSMQIPKYFGGGSVGGRGAGGGGMGGVQLVEILPHQVAQILNGLRVSVQIDGKEVAGTVNAYNTQGAIRGNR